MNNSFDQSAYLNMELLRFTTAGSVDDGKSTLIGRLLFDSKAIFQDQLDEVERASIKKGDDFINLALLTDGLRAEREQGITIDVAYRFFHTPKRKFIIADTPGHIQYTRNMVTGASTANAAVILVDARNGVAEQTVRHAYISSLLAIPHIIVCVNKMDLVGFSEEVFTQIQKSFNAFALNFCTQDIRFIPISALHGDNVVNRSDAMPWYNGPTLMYLLENMYIANDNDFTHARFPVQYVIRPQIKGYSNFRGYAGRVAGGTFCVGDRVRILPSGISTIITSMLLGDKPIHQANASQSVVISIEDDVDVGRGAMVVHEGNDIRSGQDIELMICWLGSQPLVQSAKYSVKHTSNDARCVIKDIKFKVDINTLEKDYCCKNICMNDIACIAIRTTSPLFFDSYRSNRVTGSLILIDESTNVTVAAGMIV